MSNTPLMARRLVSGRAIGRWIERLDPVADNEEAAHLSIEVRYGDAFFAHSAYLVAFARQMTIPSIARMLYRTGTGDMMHDVRRRNDDTLLFFGEMLRHGHSSEAGRAVIDRMEQIHSRYGITDEDKLYTLGSLAFEADRIVGHLGLDVFTDNERISRYHFWRGVGERMGLTVPDDRDKFLEWTLDYERTMAAHSDGGEQVVGKLFEDWHERWFSRLSRRWSDNILLAMYDEDLRAVHRLADPPALYKLLVPKFAGVYVKVQALRPHRPHRSWSDHFGARHTRPLDVSTLGIRNRLPGAVAGKGGRR